MAPGSLTVQDHQTVEYHLLKLFEKLESLRKDGAKDECIPSRPSMHAEVRTLEFWRSIISECIATFFYVFIVCGAAAGAGAGRNESTNLIASALASGFAMATLTQCFGHVSGAHVNPAVSVAMAIVRNISPLRGFMFITAQCGGGIAGAALLRLCISFANPEEFLPPRLTAWNRFGLEFILTFIVVLTYFVAMDTYRKWLGTSSLLVGGAYLACTLVMTPSLNPCRALGPAFVMNEWENHWSYWVGSTLGAGVSGLVYEFMLSPRRHRKHAKESIDGDSSSIHSDEDPYDELDKPAPPKFHGSNYNTLRTGDAYRSPMNPGVASTPASPNVNGNAYCASLTSASLYSAPPCKLDRVESLYGGTKSLYAKSPPLTRANLNRSQSVYTKVPPGTVLARREGVPKPGPLVPAQSLYPMRFNQNHTLAANQNIQNLHNQRSESVYGVRNFPNGTPRTDSGGVYGIIPGNTVGNFSGEKQSHTNNLESAYGTVTRRQSSADSSYGSYHGGGNVTGATSGHPSNYQTGNKFGVGQYAQRSDIRPSPQPTQHHALSSASAAVVNTTNAVASYSHGRHSPNPQY